MLTHFYTNYKAERLRKDFEEIGCNFVGKGFRV